MIHANAKPCLITLLYMLISSSLKCFRREPQKRKFQAAKAGEFVCSAGGKLQTLMNREYLIMLSEQWYETNYRLILLSSTLRNHVVNYNETKHRLPRPEGFNWGKALNPDDPAGSDLLALPLKDPVPFRKSKVRYGTAHTRHPQQRRV